MKLIKQIKGKSMFGGKGDGLILLRDLGLPVPEFIILKHSELLNVLIDNDAVAFNKLWNLYIKPLGKTKLAIRSSANIEDGKTNSFAGVFETILNVNNSSKSVFLATLKVFNSIKNQKIIDKTASGQMNIVVQKMIDSKIAGVAFSTVFNMAGLPECLVSYVNGQGEELVSGRAQSFDCRFLWQDMETINKTSMSFDGPSALLDLNNIYNLLPYIETVVKKINAYSDIEWCMDKNGAFWILQCRPITKNILLQPKKSDLQIASPGIANAPITIIKMLQEENDIRLDKVNNFKPGNILVADYTDIRSLPALGKCSGVIVSAGSTLSHSAIIARERGIPCIVGAEKLVDSLKPGDIVNINTDLQYIAVNGLRIPASAANNDIDWSALDLYDNIIELEINDDTVLFEYNNDGLILYCADWNSSDTIAMADLILRKRFGTAPKHYKESNKVAFYFEEQQFKTLPRFSYWRSQVDIAVIDFDIEKIMQLSEKIDAEGAILRDKRNSSTGLKALYYNEEILGLMHLMRKYLIESLLMKLVWMKSFSGLNKINKSFIDFLKPDFASDDLRLNEIHKFIMEISERRNTTWSGTQWIDNKIIPEDAYFVRATEIKNFFLANGKQGNTMDLEKTLYHDLFPELINNASGESL